MPHASFLSGVKKDEGLHFSFLPSFLGNVTLPKIVGRKFHWEKITNISSVKLCLQLVGFGQQVNFRELKAYAGPAATVRSYPAAQMTPHSQFLG